MKTKQRAVTRLSTRRAPAAEVRDSARSLSRGEIIAVDDAGAIRARLGDEWKTELDCDLLVTSGGAPLRLAPGDSVLLFLPARAGERGVVIGRIGPGGQIDETPEELVLEATTSVSLRCGESSVTLCSDGKVLVKGKDVVSHASRLNRIRGGAVSIN